MASTGLAALDDSIAAEVVEAKMVRELRPAMTSRGLVRFAVGGNSQVASFPLWGDPGAASSAGDDLTETASTALSDSQQSATADEFSFRVDITDFSRAVHASDLYAEAAGMVARSVAESWETYLATFMDDFSNVTTAASTLSPLDVLAAVSALEQRDIPAPYAGYFDPKQTGELRAEIATTTASYQIGRDGDLVRPFGDSGFFGVYMGLPIWQTSLVVEASSLHGGAVFNTTDALGAYEVYGPRVETQRDASYRATEFVGSHCFGLIEISDTRGQTVKSSSA
jgi:hypothetical protein